jgi:hypothetical protein
MKKMILCVLCVLCVDVTPVRAQIPIDQVQILNSPDVRGWTPTATITKLEFWRGAGIHVEFDRNAAWPDVVPEGWNGPIQYTVWAAEHRRPLVRLRHYRVLARPAVH